MGSDKCKLEFMKQCCQKFPKASINCSLNTEHFCSLLHNRFQIALLFAWVSSFSLHRSEKQFSQQSRTRSGAARGRTPAPRGRSRGPAARTRAAACRRSR